MVQVRFGLQPQDQRQVVRRTHPHQQRGQPPPRRFIRQVRGNGGLAHPARLVPHRHHPQAQRLTTARRLRTVPQCLHARIQPRLPLRRGRRIHLPGYRHQVDLPLVHPLHAGDLRHAVHGFPAGFHRQQDIRRTVVAREVFDQRLRARVDPRIQHQHVRVGHQFAAQVLRVAGLHRHPKARIRRQRRVPGLQARNGPRQQHRHRIRRLHQVIRVPHLHTSSRASLSVPGCSAPATAAACPVGVGVIVGPG